MSISIRKLSLSLALVLPLLAAVPGYSQDQDEALEPVDADIPVAEVVVEQDHLAIKIGKSEYKLEDPKAGDAFRAPFESLSESDKVSFQNNRRIFLGMASRAMNLLKYGFGVGSIVKEKIKYQIQKMKDRNEVAYMNTYSDGVQADYFAARDRSIEAERVASLARVPISFRERSQQVVLGFLRGLDSKLWQQAPLFSRSNEFGVMAAGGIEILGGKRSKGWGGADDIGISIGYNRDERTLAFQIFNDFERYKGSQMPAVFLAGAYAKLGTYVANQRTGELVHEGVSFYPPMMPAFSQMTQENFMAGFSSGLTWPPSPIGDMLTYSNKLNQGVLLRITISPFTKGFVRIYTGLGINTIKAVVTTVRDGIQKIVDMGNRAFAIRCSGIFIR